MIAGAVEDEEDQANCSDNGPYNRGQSSMENASGEMFPIFSLGLFTDIVCNVYTSRSRKNTDGLDYLPYQRFEEAKSLTTFLVNAQKMVYVCLTNP
jgi:hypothetical protein